MKWSPAPVWFRILSLLTSGLCGVAAWYLTELGASGVEDVPPPFILVAVTAGIVFLGLTIFGRYPRRR